MSIYKYYLIPAYDAALAASSVIMNIYNSEFAINWKEDHSPLTEADMQSHHTITDLLSLTGIPVLSEESKEISYEIRSTWEMLWIVDPLDGTKEFIHRNGEFTINIALVENGLPVFGLIFIPVTKTIYYGIKGMGAFKYQSTGEAFTDADEMILASQAVHSHGIENNKINVGISRSHLNETTSDFITSLKTKGYQINLVPSGSALKFGLLAENSIQLYPRFAPTMEWDTAAGQVIIEESGAVMESYPEKQKLLYNKECLLNPGFIARSTDLLYL